MKFLSLFKRFRNSNKECRILLLGLDNAGKSTLLKFLAGEDLHVTPTIGFKIKTVQRDNLRMHIWDIGGQKSLRNYWRNYFQDTDILIYVVDSTDHKRLEESGQAFSLILEEDKLAGVPVLVLANKQDLSLASTPDEIAEGLCLLTLRDRDWNIQACSGLTGDGVQDAINWILARVK